MQKLITLGDLFPSYDDPREIDPRLIDLVQLCAEIGLPFPAEPKRGYSSWWHALHEIMHWAVKPPWYVEYAKFLRDDLAVREGSFTLPAGTIQGIESELVLPRLQVYRGGNDVIPDIFMPGDPTLNETAVRTCSLLIMRLYGWDHPLAENLLPDGSLRHTTGDFHFHKPSSGQVWHPMYADDQDTISDMIGWGINLQSQVVRFRPENDGFSLPHPHAASIHEFTRNMGAITDAFGCFEAEWFEVPEYRDYWLGLVKSHLQLSD